MIIVNEWASIRILSEKGHSLKKISKLLKMSRNTVRKAILTFSPSFLPPNSFYYCLLFGVNIWGEVPFSYNKLTEKGSDAMKKSKFTEE